jgi:CopG family nickel-responsive transcriptional regulator
MSELVRFGVAMDRALLVEFDRRISARGYENRSEALRDLVRADLTRAASEGGALVAATLTVVHAPEASSLLGDARARYPNVVRTTLSVPLDAQRLMSVLVLRGTGSACAELAGQLGAARGVLACELAVAAALEPSAFEDDRS